MFWRKEKENGRSASADAPNTAFPASANAAAAVGGGVQLASLTIERERETSVEERERDAPMMPVPVNTAAERAASPRRTQDRPAVTVPPLPLPSTNANANNNSNTNSANNSNGNALSAAAAAPAAAGGEKERGRETFSRSSSVDRERDRERDRDLEAALSLDEALQETLSSLSVSLAGSSAREREIAEKVLRDVALCRLLFTENRKLEAALLLLEIETFVRTSPSLAHTLNETDSLATPRPPHTPHTPHTQKARDLLLDTLQTDKTLDAIRSSHGSLAQLLVELGDDTLWNEWNSSIGPHQDVSVSTHTNDSTHDYALKISGRLRDVKSVREIAAALSETQLFPLWVPMCRQCMVIQSKNATRKIVRLDLDFVMLKKTAILDVAFHHLPDGRSVLSFSSLPMDDSSRKFYPSDTQRYMMLSGALVLQRENILVEAPVPANDALGCSSQSDKNKFNTPRKFRASLTSNGPTTAEKYLVNMDDIYMSARDGRPTSNPLKSTPRTAGKSTQGDLPIHHTPRSWFEAEPKRVQSESVRVEGIFKADLLTELMPDWIFNLAVRSSISMFIPMLEHHAALFAEGEYHHATIKNHSTFYDKIERMVAGHH